MSVNSLRKSEEHSLDSEIADMSLQSLGPRCAGQNRSLATPFICHPGQAVVDFTGPRGN